MFGFDGELVVVNNDTFVRPLEGGCKNNDDVEKIEPKTSSILEQKQVAKKEAADRLKQAIERDPLVCGLVKHFDATITKTEI